MSVCVWARLVAQSCPTLCNPMDCILPSSSIHGMIQARRLERVAMPSSRGSSQPRYTHHLLRKKKFFVVPWAPFWRRQWHPTPILLPGKSHGWRSLVGYGPWGLEESDTTERFHFHFSLSCIGAGNGNPLPCSCLENPRGGGAWWADVCGVAQSWTQLKWLSSSRAPFPNSNPFPSLKSN